MDIAKRLQYFLDKKNLSAYAFSKKSEVSQSMISSILRGEKNPTVITLSLLCKALDITLTDFFSENDEISVELTQLLNSAKSLTPEQISILNDFLKTMK